MSRNRFAVAVLAYLAAVLCLGGASAAGFAANALLQVGGALLIAACLWRQSDSPGVQSVGLARFALAYVVLAAVQFVPLPAFAWTSLPGRDAIAAGYRLLGITAPWHTLSLAPWSSLASLAWAIPALALFFAMKRSDAPHPRTAARAVVAIAVVSVGIGAMQRAGGQLYLYSITNYGMGTGFFANANHQASFLLAALALWAADFYQLSRDSRRVDRERVRQGLFFGVALLLVIGVLLSNSLAGIGLLAPVIAGIVLMSRPDFRPSRAATLAALALAGVAVLAFAGFGSLENDWSGPPPPPGHSRTDYLKTGLKIARDMAPFGSGLGTFVDVYRTYEDPMLVGTTYVNHAHDDLLEIVIECGVFGLAAVALFLAWWSRRAYALWTGKRNDPFALAGAILTGAILAHSLVDYPLRTAAMSGLFAIGCALMVRPRPSSGHERRTHDPAREHDLVAI